MIDSTRWIWMQNYRVWEANLKVFLYPENWIEAELRDDKSPFFRELESELLQAEVTTDTAEIALGNYLEKLDTVSQLQICGMHEQFGFEPDEKRERVLHVFGRTFATPRIFYYRQLVTVKPNYRYWTAWEKVPLDIEAETDEVLPGIWNRRLYVFWQVHTKKTEETTLIRLAWSEYRQGKWSKKRVTAAGDAVAIAAITDSTTRMDLETGGNELTIIFASFLRTACLTGKQFDENGILKGEAGQQTTAFAERHASLTFRNHSGLIEPHAGSLKRKFYDHGFVPMDNPLTFNPVTCVDQPIEVFGRRPDTGIRLFSPGSQPYTLDNPFFSQDGPRTYLVEPRNFQQSTIEHHLSTAEAASAYVPLSKASGIASNTKASLDSSVQGQFTQLSAVANPWSSGRASIALVEHQSSSVALASNSDTTASLSTESRIFHAGVVKPVNILLRALAEFRFETFFHPYTAEFQRRLNRYGVPGLLNITSQRPEDLPKLTTFQDAYLPESTVKRPLPEHRVDFAFSGAYSLYNWEIFFHVPLFLATRLSQNQRFEEAMRWFHYIFDPTAGSPEDPKLYWSVLPLRETQSQRLDDMLKALHAGDADVIAQWEDLQAHPFQPHRVARLRRVAYQKTVVMKYIDNLIAWGDQLFRRDTIETINQATQLYVLAATLLGPRVQRVPPRGRDQSKTYAQLRLKQLDKFNQAIVDYENDLPFSSRATTSESSTETSGLLGIGRSFYFCLPKNDKLLAYWDTVANRLFNIRHCMNIEGLVRELPLFEPPIDPALLVKAAAQGIDLSSVLSDLSAPLPYYRFNTLLAKSLEMTAELRSLGGALLAALEKRDAEHLSNLRASNESELLSLVKQVKQQQLDEAKAAEAALQKSRELTQTRFDFYNNVAQRIPEETSQLEELDASQTIQETGQSAEILAEALIAPTSDISLGFSPGGMDGAPRPSISFSAGRSNIIAIIQALSRARSFLASVHSFKSNRSSIIAGWTRRADDWKLQKDLATKELAQIDKQIAAAGIRVAVAQQELDNTTRQIEQSQEIQEFLRNKFTGEELYSWMVGDISTIFFQCYQMTYDLAKKAERCYRFERGLVNSNFIQFGAWDSMRKGLLSGERLYLQLKQMERAYLDGNRREYELTKHYSLVMNDPLELIKLKEQGSCEIDLPETLFDIDFPGHYMRRVKSVSVSIPAVVGPYTGVNCTLTLLRDKTRVKNTPVEGYTEREDEEDDRFLTSWTRMQAIAASGGQNDSGMFELNFRDERYLPFEGAGVMSRWRIELPREFRQFDYDTISDVVLHFKYTARDGGMPLRDAAVTNLKQRLLDDEGKPQIRLFSLRHEFPSEWHKLRTIADNNGDHTQAFSLAKPRFPFVFQGGTITVNSIEIFGMPKDRAENSPAPELKLTLAGPNEPPLELKKAAAVGSLVRKVAKDATIEVNNLGETEKEADWTIKVLKSDVAVSLERLADILLLCHYSVEMPKKP